MRISKKRLRDIIINDIVDNGLEKLKKRFSGHWTAPLTESIRKGRRNRNLPVYLASEIDYHSSHYIRSKGFKTRVYANYDQEDPDETVRIKLFSKGHRHTWILIPKDIAEKIIVLGMVPNLS